MTHSSAANPLVQLITNFPYAQVLYVAAKLRLADLLADGPREVDSLARQTGTHAASLNRLLRMLSALGVVKEQGDGLVGLTELGSHLRSGAPGSLRDRVLFLASPWFWRSWEELLYSVQTGQPAFDRVFGMSNFEHWKHSLEARTAHEAYFVAMAQITTPAILQAYDYSRFRVIADIGGSRGALLAALLNENPGAQGILFDLPHIVADAGPVLAEAGVAKRCQVIAGDFFESVPGGADAYILKYIIHDWDDERAATILRRCRSSMTTGARLLIIEHVLPERVEGTPSELPALLMDMRMLVLTPGGRERTASEYGKLLQSAGFRTERVVSTGTPLGIVEAVPT